MDTAPQAAAFGGDAPAAGDADGLSRGALLSSAGDRSPDGLAPTRLLFSPLTEAQKRARALRRRRAPRSRASLGAQVGLPSCRTTRPG